MDFLTFFFPEIVAAQKYSGKLADVWSLGVIFYTLVVGYLPFDEDNETEMHKKIVDLEFEIPDFLDKGTRVICSQLNTLIFTNRHNGSSECNASPGSSKKTPCSRHFKSQMV